DRPAESDSRDGSVSSPPTCPTRSGSAGKPARPLGTGPLPRAIAPAAVGTVPDNPGTSARGETVVSALHADSGPGRTLRWLPAAGPSPSTTGPADDSYLPGRVGKSAPGAESASVAYAAPAPGDMPFPLRLAGPSRAARRPGRGSYGPVPEGSRVVGETPRPAVG